MNKKSKFPILSSLNYKNKIGDKKNVVLFIEGSEELCSECDVALKLLDEVL